MTEWWHIWGCLSYEHQVLVFILWLAIQGEILYLPYCNVIIAHYASIFPTNHCCSSNHQGNVVVTSKPDGTPRRVVALHPKPLRPRTVYFERDTSQGPRWQGSCVLHRAHLRPSGPRLAPAGPHEPCSQGSHQRNRHAQSWLIKSNVSWRHDSDTTQHHGGHKIRWWQNHVP